MSVVIKHIFMMIGAIVSIGAIFALVSCTKQSGETNGFPGGEQGNGQGEKLRLTVTTSGLETAFENGAATRSGSPRTRVTTVAATDAECKINTLYLLFFNSADGLFVDWVQVAGIDDPAKTDWDLDLSGSAIRSTEAYNILAVANPDGYIDAPSVDGWMSRWQGKTEAETVTLATATATAGTDPLTSGLPMHGRFEKAKKQMDINIPLKRCHARIEVANNISAQYELVSTTLCNAYRTSTIWGGEKTGTTTDFPVSTPRVAQLYTVAGGGPVYAFENLVAEPSRGDDITTAVVVGLRKTGETDHTYYRADIAPHNASHSVKPDNAYLMTIRGVSGPGKTTVQEALDATGHNPLSYIINDWQMGTGDAETFLHVKLPEGGIPLFPATAGAVSGLISVDASGPWRAKLYMDGFSLAGNDDVREITAVDSDDFRVWTRSANGSTDIRQAFLLVSLDADPQNYAFVVQLSQAGTN